MATKTTPQERMAKARQAKQRKDDELAAMKEKVAKLEQMVANTPQAGAQDEPPKHYVNPRDKSTSRKVTAPPMRKPMGHDDIFKFDDLKEPGYVYRLVNDVKDGARIQLFKQYGWELVPDPFKVSQDDRAGAASRQGTYVSQNVGNGIIAYLMRIKEEWYEEYRQMKQKTIDDVEKGLSIRKTGSNETTSYKDISNAYGEIRISNTG